jgi:hypothetical protein
MPTPSYVSEPLVQFLSTILQEVRMGMLQVPHFQRPFLWKLDQQLELLRSIRDGLPIGSIMVWRTHLGKIACYAKLGPHRVPTSPHPENSSAVRQYLLDGVQRLSTLFGALYPPDGKAAIEVEAPAFDSDVDVETKSVWYDLNTRDFVALSTDQIATPQYAGLLPTDALLDTIKLVKLQRQFPEARADVWIEASDEIARAFRDYKIAVVPLVTDDIEVATRTFQRINSQGTVMSEIHMVHALSWSQSFNLLSRIDELATEHLRPIGWGEIAGDRVLDVYKAALGIEVYGTAADALSQRLRAAPDGLEHAVNNIADAAGFLGEECNIRAPELIPYAHQITLLAEAFRCSRTLDTSRRELLRAWFWLTSYAELFAGISGARLQRMLVDMRAMMDDAAPRWSGARPFGLRALQPIFDFRSARAKTLALRLAALKPLDPTGEPVDPTELLALHGRQAVNPLLPRSQITGNLHGSPGNRFLVRPQHVGALRDALFATAPGAQCTLFSASDREELLRSHVVSETALAYLHAGNRDAFIQQRKRDLDDMEKSFVQPLRALFYP